MVVLIRDVIRIVDKARYSLEAPNSNHHSLNPIPLEGLGFGSGFSV